MRVGCTGGWRAPPTAFLGIAIEPADEDVGRGGEITLGVVSGSGVPGFDFSEPTGFLAMLFTLLLSSLARDQDGVGGAGAGGRGN